MTKLVAEVEPDATSPIGLASPPTSTRGKLGAVVVIGAGGGVANRLSRIDLRELDSIGSISESNEKRETKCGGVSSSETACDDKFAIRLGGVTGGVGSTGVAGLMGRSRKAILSNLSSDFAGRSGPETILVSPDRPVLPCPC